MRVVNLREVGLIPGSHLGATALASLLCLVLVILEVHPSLEDSQGVRWDLKGCFLDQREREGGRGVGVGELPVGLLLA